MHLVTVSSVNPSLKCLLLIKMWAVVLLRTNTQLWDLDSEKPNLHISIKHVLVCQMITCSQRSLRCSLWRMSSRPFFYWWDLVPLRPKVAEGEHASFCLIPDEQDVGEVRVQAVHHRSQPKTLGFISVLTLPFLTAASLSNF